MSQSKTMQVTLVVACLCGVLLGTGCQTVQPGPSHTTHHPAHPEAGSALFIMPLLTLGEGPVEMKPAVTDTMSHDHHHEGHGGH